MDARIAGFVAVITHLPQIENFASDLEQHWRERLNPMNWFGHQASVPSTVGLPPVFDGRSLPPQTQQQREQQSLRSDIAQEWNSPTYNIHTDVHLDGKTIARHTQQLTQAQMRRKSAQERRATSGTADGLSTSQVPGAAW